MWNAPVGAGESPPNVRVTDVHSSNLTIEWDGFSKCRFINGRITKYKVLYSAKPNGTIQSAYKNKDIYHTWDTGRIISLVGLSPYTNYSIQVAAVNIFENEGKYSDPITAQTAEDGIHTWHCMLLEIHLSSTHSPFCYLPFQLPVQWSSHLFLLSSI